MSARNRFVLAVFVIVVVVGVGNAQQVDERWENVPVINGDFDLPGEPALYHFYPMERYSTAIQEAIAWWPFGDAGTSEWNPRQWVGFAFNAEANPENGLRQTLADTFSVGTYRLSVLVNGNGPWGSASKVSLGFLDGGSFTIVGVSELEVPAASFPTWIEQELIVAVPDGNEALGRPIVVKLEAIARSGTAGDSNRATCWDTVELSYRK